MSKHTQGPWVVTGKTWEGDGAAGVMVEAESGGAIAFVTSWFDRGLPAEVEEANYANAHLIAAAPDLLEMLELIVLTAKKNKPARYYLEGACAVIAKARGEA